MIIGVVGAGVMGRGIVQLFAQSGYRVRLFDTMPGAAAAAKNMVTPMLERMAAKGALTQEALTESIANMQVCGKLDDLTRCDLVVEAIIESLDAKQSLFRELESIVSETTILATNTSSFTVSGIAALCAHPNRVVGLHFFNPVPLMKIVEIIPGIRTEPNVVEILRKLVGATGHKAVTAADQPGFLINHAGRGLYGEGFRVVEEGVTDFAGVDRIMRDCCGFRMGPFELMDLTGLDVSAKVMQSIFDQFQQDPRYRPSSLVLPRIASGLFGRKTNEGFYKYDGGKKLEPAQPETPSNAGLCKVYVADTERSPELKGILTQAGAVVVEGPDDDVANIVMPWGQDITSIALASGLDPSRTLGVDPILHWDRRMTLMTSPTTLPVLREALHACVASDKFAVSVIADSPGFVAQRIIAMIVNIACEIAQRGISRAAEIDPAVRLGLGYPAGPLELGDQIGAAKILQILENIQSITGDPRYRPSLWLRRRTALGLSLLHEAA